MLLQETNFRSKDTQTESGGWKKVCNANGNEKKAGVAILISNKIDFRSEVENKPMDTKGGKQGGGDDGMNWEIGTDIFTLICIKQITNKNLLYKKNKQIKLNLKK